MVTLCVPGLIGRSDTLIISSTSGFSPESQIELPSSRTSARRMMKSGAPFQWIFAPSFDAYTPSSTSIERARERNSASRSLSYSARSRATSIVAGVAGGGGGGGLALSSSAAGARGRGGARLRARIAREQH